MLKRMRTIGILILVCVVTCFSAYSTGLANAEDEVVEPFNPLPLEMSTKEFIGKLKLGMNAEEVEAAVGYPQEMWSFGFYRPVYRLYHGGTYTHITLHFNINSLSMATNGDGIDLLSDEFTAHAVDFPLSIDGTEITINDPVVTIQDRTYIPLDEFCDALDINWTESETMTENADEINLLSDELTAYAADFPLIIDGYEVTISNPIVTIEGRTYVPLREFCDAMHMDISWIEAERKIEISTNVGNESFTGFTLKDFKFLKLDMDMRYINDTIVGEPSDYYAELGLFWGIYQLADGSKLHLQNHATTQLKAVVLETSDGFKIPIPFDEEGNLMIY